MAGWGVAEPTDRCRFGSRKDTGWLEPGDQRQSGERSEGTRATAEGRSRLC